MSRKDFCKEWGHNAKVVLDNQEVQIERCIECKESIRYNKDEEGRIDNKRYYREHRRDFLQPGMKGYARFYDIIKKTKDSKELEAFKKKAEEAEQEGKARLESEKIRDTFSTGKRYF